MLSTTNEKGFPSLYITLQMPSLIKWTLKGSSRKREISTSPGASQCMDIFNSSPQKLRLKLLDVGLNRSQTLLQIHGTVLCRAMATGKWEAVPALQLECWPESTHCLPPDLRVIMLWDIKRLFCASCAISSPNYQTVPPQMLTAVCSDGTGYRKADTWGPQWLTTTCPTANRLMQSQPKSF